MNGLFGFDPKTLSDEELLDRWHKINKRMGWTMRYGSNEIMAQLQAIKQSIEFEQRERIIEPRLRARAAMPAVTIETDPELAAEAKAIVDAELEAIADKNRPHRPKPFALTRDRIKPSARPTSGN